MTTIYFKAVLKGVMPSNKSKQMTVFGISDRLSDIDTDAVRIGTVRGFGHSVVLKKTTYKTGEGWFKAQHGVTPNQYRKSLYDSSKGRR